MLDVAYIGFGNSVRNYHLPSVKKRENIRIKKVFRLEEEKNTEREQLYTGIEFTSDIDAIKNDEEINLVVIATPNQFHVPYAKEMLNAGKNVMVEKPFAPTVKEAEEVHKLAKEKGLLAYVNHNRRYDGDYLALKEVIESGVLGELVEVKSHYDYFRPFVRTGLPLVYNMGAHMIDQMVSLFGVPNKVDAYVHSFNRIENGCDYYDISLLYENLRVSVSTSYFVKTPYPRFVVHGKKGSFIKYGTPHISGKEKKEPFEIDFTVEPESDWAVVEYVDGYGNTIKYRHPSKVTDYARVYDDIDAIINNGAQRVVTEKQVIAGLRILDEAAAKVC